MNDRVALYIALVIAVAIGLDLLLNEGQFLLFLLRKFLNLVDWIQFWR